MKASELRIGNLVLHKGSEIVVNGISPHCNGYAINTDKVFKRVITDLEGIETIVEEVRPTWVYLKKCIPIQLTEEWLLKFGFEYKSGWDDFNYYTMDGVELYVTLKGFEYDDQIIETVNRVQNLFFALREKELEIKEL